MKLNKKVFISVLSIICMITILIGSMAYYRIVVNGSITGNTGNAVFVLRDTEAGESWNSKVISLGTINPGDSGSFDVVMDASGSSVNMYATLNIDRGTGDTELPKNLKFYTTADHKSELHKYYSFLEKNGTNKEKLTLYWYWNPYISDEEDNKYVNKTFTANITVNAVQISEYATMKNGYSSSNGGTEFWSDNYKPYIKTINFGNDLSNLPSTCNEENLCWDISESQTQNKKVYGYLVDTGLKDSTDNTKPLYNLYIVSEAPIFAPQNCSYIFSFYKAENNKKISNLTQINFNDNFNTSNVTFMIGMFYRCLSLTNLDLSNFNTINVTDMFRMFTSCKLLTNLDLSSFNTINITTMTNVFWLCESLTSLDLSNFNTINVTDMRYTFASCSSLISLDLSNFNTSNVTSMNSMFNNCKSLTSLDLSNFNTSNVINMSNMFENCSSLTSLDLSSFNTAGVTDMGGMIGGCSSLTSLDLSNFNTANVTNMNQMFDGCSSLTTTINIMNANISEYSSMFSNAATNSGSQIIVNYIASASTLVDNMIATKSQTSNVIKGIQL